MINVLALYFVRLVTPVTDLLYFLVLQIMYEQFTAIVFNPKTVYHLIMVTDEIVIFFPLKIIGTITHRF